MAVRHGPRLGHSAPAKRPSGILYSMKQLSTLQKAALGAIGIVVGGVATGLGLRKIKQVAAVEVASTPKDLSWKSWKRALIETKKAIADRNLSMLAAGVAYGGTLAFFPLVVACVAIASIVLAPEQIKDIASGLSAFLSKDIASLLSTQLVNALDNHSANVLVAVAAIALALFGVSGAMNSLVNALNTAYDVTETRNFLKVRLTSLGLTSMMIVGMLIILPLIVLGETILRGWQVPEGLITLFSIVRWVILAVVMSLGLSVLYRYAPDRVNARWQWVSWGAIMATLLWLVVTALFFIYIQYFASFNESYSLFAGIIVLMMWLNFTGLIVLVGAEINSQLERRTVLPTK